MAESLAEKEVGGKVKIQLRCFGAVGKEEIKHPRKSYAK